MLQKGNYGVGGIGLLGLLFYPLVSLFPDSGRNSLLGVRLHCLLWDGTNGMHDVVMN